MTEHRIGFIGGGNMARSLIGGLVNDGFPPDGLCVSDVLDERRSELQASFGVRAFADNDVVVRACDVLVLAVKPQALRPVLGSIAATVREVRPLLISIAAGVRLQDIQRWAGDALPIVRVMPNTPALVRSGASALFANEHVSESQRDVAESLLRAVGVTAWLDTEEQLDTVTALSGSGPAYFFYLMEAMEAAAVELGLDHDTARLLTLETAFGASKLALETHEAFAALRRRVTSPGGTTEAAIGVFDRQRMGATIAAGVAAAQQRSKELAAVIGEG